MKDKRCVLQDDLKDCGISALLSIIRYYNGNASKEYLRDITNTSKDGVNAYDLLKASRELGFDAYGLKGNLEYIKKEDFPLIAHVVINKSYQHFVVIYKIDLKKETIVIMDPSYGIKKVSLSEWQNISTNNYLIFKPKKKIPNLVEERSFIDILWPIIKEYKLILVVVLAFSLIHTFLNIVTSYNFKILLDEISITTTFDLWLLFFVLIILAIIKLMTNLFRNNLINYLNHNLDKVLFQNAYCHIINLPYLYYKNRTTGDILTRINDLGNVKELIGRLFIACCIDSLLIVFLGIVLFKIEHVLTLINIGILLAYILVVIMYQKTFTKNLKESYQASSEVNTYTVESLTMINTIKSFLLEDKVINTIQKKYSKLSHINEKLLRMVNWQEFFKNLILVIGNLIVIFYGILKIKKGALNINTLITYISLLTYFIEPIKNITDLNFTWNNAKESLKRIKELYEIPCEKKIIKNRYKINKIEGDILIKNLTYSYNGRDNILSNVNLQIRKGEKVLLYGKSGGGKSTLMKLLIRYFDNYQGVIEIDGYNLNTFDLLNLRQKICYVSQDEGLFTDSIYNNIILGKNIEYKRFLEIAKLVGVEEVVQNSPLGYDLLVEEGGFNLSLGERQRIVLARTLLQEADIYILDEALNAIDIQKERIILKNIFKILKDKTVILVSHRFHNSDLFDRKISIRDGENGYRNNRYRRIQ